MTAAQSGPQPIIAGLVMASVHDQADPAIPAGGEAALPEGTLRRRAVVPRLAAPRIAPAAPRTVPAAPHTVPAASPAAPRIAPAAGRVRQDRAANNTKRQGDQGNLYPCLLVSTSNCLFVYLFSAALLPSFRSSV